MCSLGFELSLASLLLDVDISAVFSNRCYFKRIEFGIEGYDKQIFKNSSRWNPFGLPFGILRAPVGSPSTQLELRLAPSKAFSNNFRIVLGVCLDNARIILGSLWDRFGIIFG